MKKNESDIMIDTEINIDEENLENFTFKDFFQFKNEPIEKKTTLFNDFFQHMIKEGYIMREVTSASSHRMTVVDSTTGTEHEVLMFGSNNYLGLANEKEVKEAAIQAINEMGVGCGGPPLLNGTTKYHRKLEKRIADVKDCEDAMLYSSGFSANLGWTTGLLGEGDYLVYDIQSHASLYDGIKLGRFEAVKFLHNDVNDLEKQLKMIRNKSDRSCIVAVEGVYSMDGDIAPLPEIRELCEKYNALLCVDDAHGSGVLGKKGKGTSEHFGMKTGVDIVMGTFSKTFGVVGGFIAGDQKLINYLRAFSRPFMFSAALPFPVVAAVSAGIEFIKANPERVHKLRENAEYMFEGLKKLGFDAICHTAIIPIFIPEQFHLRKLINNLHREGIFINGVEYPAVPKHRQRLRMSMMATFEKEDLDFGLSKFEKVGKEMGII